MFSLFSDNEMNFDVASSPISNYEMRQQDTDFTMGFNPQSPSKIGEISAVDQDFFSDFSTFDSTLTMSPGLVAMASLNFNFNDQPQQQVQPVTQNPVNTTKKVVMPDISINRTSSMYNNNCIQNINSNVYQRPTLYPIPSTISKENSNSNIQYSQPQKQNQKEPINIIKKQKLKRKCEVFQPFTSFANLEMTVKSLRNIVKSNSVCAPTSTRIYAPPPPQPILA